MEQIPFTDLHSQYREIKDAIDQAISSTISGSDFILSDKVRLFEEEFSAWNGSSHCIGCANGTDAIEIALEALGVGAGDHVIVPAMTWISTAEAVIRVGATPVFVDVDPNTYCVSLELVERSITSRTRAIIAVHLYGFPADVSRLRKLCDSRSIYLIEDCAQAHGAMVDEYTKVGNVGHVGTFSFFPGKNLGAYGDAGCIVTNDQSIASVCRELGNHGQIRKHDHVRIGRNSRLDGIQAAILSAKLPHLDCWLDRRRTIASLYLERLRCCSIGLPYCPRPEWHAFHLYVVICDQRDDLYRFLVANGIQVAIHYPRSLPQICVFEPYIDAPLRSNGYPVARRIAEQALSIPMSDQLSIDHVELISSCINRYFATR